MAASAAEAIAAGPGDTAAAPREASGAPATVAAGRAGQAHPPHPIRRGLIRVYRNVTPIRIAVDGAKATAIGVAIFFAADFLLGLDEQFARSRQQVAATGFLLFLLSRAGRMVEREGYAAVRDNFGWLMASTSAVFFGLVSLRLILQDWLSQGQ